MTEDDWNKGLCSMSGHPLAGDAIEETEAKGRRIIGDTLLILLNAHHEALPFIMPAHKRGVRWGTVIRNGGKRRGKGAGTFQRWRFAESGGEIAGRLPFTGVTDKTA